MSHQWNGNGKKLTKQSRGLEEVGGALFVLGVARVANDEVHREDFGTKRYFEQDHVERIIYRVSLTSC